MHPTSALVELHPFLASLVVIFLAELGDKTLFTLVILAASHDPVPVVLGGWLAFLVQGGIAVGLGTLFTHLPTTAIHWGTAAVFLGCGLWLLLKREENEETAAETEPSKPSAWRQFSTAFGLVFIAEFGDATQVGSAALVADTRAPLQVFAGATLGLWAGTLLAVGVGKFIGNRFPTLWVRRTAGVLFCVLALASALRA